MNSETLFSMNVKDVLRPMAREICSTIPAPSSWVVSANRKQLVQFILDSGTSAQDTSAQSASQALSAEEIRGIVREEVERLTRVFCNFLGVHHG